MRRRDEPPQHRRNTFRVNRKLEAEYLLIRRPVAFSILQLEQPIRIDGDCIGLDRCRCGDRAGNDFALHDQALHARIDQAGAQLRQKQHAGDEFDQADHIDEDDAPGKTREALLDKKLPAEAKDAGEELPSPTQHVGHAVGK